MYTFSNFKLKLNFSNYQFQENPTEKRSKKFNNFHLFNQMFLLLLNPNQKKHTVIKSQSITTKHKSNKKTNKLRVYVDVEMKKGILNEDFSQKINSACTTIKMIKSKL